MLWEGEENSVNRCKRSSANVLCQPVPFPLAITAACSAAVRSSPTARQLRGIGWALMESTFVTLSACHSWGRGDGNTLYLFLRALRDETQANTRHQHLF